MVELAVWLLACYGIVFLLADSTILAAPRGWLLRRSQFVANLLGCYFCLGFWVALGTSFLMPLRPSWIVFYGFAGATSCYVLDAAVRRLEGAER